LSKLEVGKGAAYLYIETIAAMFSSYLLWLIITKITTAEVIGIASAVVSMSSIFTTIIMVGVPSGVQRFLGKTFAEERLDDSRVYIKASIILVFAGITVCSISMLFAKDWLSNVFKMDPNLIILSIIFIGTSAVATLFRSVVIASLKTKILPLASIISTLVKLIATVALIYFGMAVVGVIIGFTLYPTVSAIILAVSIFFMTFGESKYKRQVQFGPACKDIMTASVASWIPGLIATVGSQLGLIVVLGWNGASQAGVYSIAFSIVLGISTGMSVLSSIAFPALSAMTDGRKRFAWRIIKMSLTISLPFSSALVFYSSDVMKMFGANYVEGSSTLAVLLLSMLPTAVMSGISTLVYSYGNYKQVLTIGLASTIPRVLFYFILVPIYGGMGAALSYNAGSIMVLIVSLIISRKIGMTIFWKDLALLFIIPTGIAFILSYVGLNYIIGILVTLFISYIVFLKLLILNRSDVQDSLGILPKRIAMPTTSLVLRVAKKLNRSF
jgi:O-antigen/teichoic acid export membrane protein